LLFVIPGLIGLFWGAPLVARELETGSFRLAWTQSITRTRWLGCKLAVAGGAAVAATGLLSLMTTWWFEPLDRVNANRFAWDVFDARNLVPIGYAAFAFMLGVAAGILTRRTLPAMVATLLGFIAVRFTITDWVRPNLLSASHAATVLQRGSNLGFVATTSSPSSSVTFVDSNPVIANAWVLSSRIVDKGGHTQTAQALHAFIERACPTIGSPPDISGSGHATAQAAPSAFNDCVAHLSAKFHLAATYQPASHYWPLQWLELGVYLALSLILAAICLGLVRRRLS
jgi:hypothetical protein